MMQAFNSVALSMLMKHTAVIKAIPDGNDDTARTIVISALQCSAPQALDAQEKERAGMGRVARLFRVHMAVPTIEVTTQHRFVIDGTDYRIRGITAVPKVNPRYWELLIEDEGVTG